MEGHHPALLAQEPWKGRGPNLNVHRRAQVPHVPGERPAQVPNLHSLPRPGRREGPERKVLNHMPLPTPGRKKPGRGRGGDIYNDD